MKLVTSSGTAVAEYSYDAWGNLLSSSGTMAEINPLRYRGYYYDTETSFYYLQSRYYDPVNHRFINADSHASTDSTDAIACNMFAYCGNNPVVYADESGNYAYYIVTGIQTDEGTPDKDGRMTYNTTVCYIYVSMNPYVLFAPESRIEGAVTYEYTVKSNGAISYDNSKNKGGELGDRAISIALAGEMYSAATNQVEGSLSGRTIAGIARELRMHKQFSFFGGKVRIADIGGLDKTKPDYDYNAKMFEILRKTPNVIWEMLFQ